MSEAVLNISAWRRRRSYVQASITKMLKRVCVLEDKNSLSERDKLIVQRLTGDFREKWMPSIGVYILK